MKRQWKDAVHVSPVQRSANRRFHCCPKKTFKTRRRDSYYCGQHNLSVWSIPLSYIIPQKGGSGTYQYWLPCIPIHLCHDYKTQICSEKYDSQKLGSDMWNHVIGNCCTFIQISSDCVLFIQRNPCFFFLIFRCQRFYTFVRFVGRWENK